MQHRLISLPALHLARRLGLVRAVEPVEWVGPGPWRWSLIVHGLGFRRLLEDVILDAPGLHRPGAHAARARRFASRRDAVRYLRSIGLSARRDEADVT